MFNIFFLVGFAIFVGFALAIWITRSSPNAKPAMAALEEAAEKESSESRARKLGFKELYEVGSRLCQEYQLEIKEQVRHSENEIYWVTESKNPVFFGNYIFGFIADEKEIPTVTLADILEFKDFIKSSNSQKGFLFTTGYFTRDVYQPLEGRLVVLYNRQQVLTELGKAVS